jgi:hypothetical protein
MKNYFAFVFLLITSFCFAQKADHKKTAVQVLDWMNKKG